MAHTPPILVVESGPKYVSEVRAEGHVVVADMPVAEGGHSSGLQPFGFVLAGLGACTNMTLRLYADRKGWNIGRVQTLVSMAADNSIAREIEFDGALDAEQRQRLLAIADHCPVHKFLAAGGAKIVTTSRS
jgi:putative redox protein